MRSLIARFCGFNSGLSQGTPATMDLALHRYSSTAAVAPSSKRLAAATRRFLRNSPSAQLFVLLLVLLMTSMVIDAFVLSKLG